MPDNEAISRQTLHQAAPSEAEGCSSYMAAGCTFKGELQISGDAELAAVCEGDIISQGTLVIAESGEVNGDISGNDVRVFGRVAGDIVCSSRLELHAGARVNGSITSPRVIMHDGVVFEGDCRMPEGEAPFVQTALDSEESAEHAEPLIKKVNS